MLGSRLIEMRYSGVVSYAVRRCEFDDFLLRRAAVRVIDGQQIRTLRKDHDVWIANDFIEAPVVVGAGGHFCPVAAHLRGAADRDRPVIAKEAEFRLKAAPAEGFADAPDLFFCRDLEGYGWCVRKGDYVNVGIGRRESRDFGTHVKDFLSFLEHRYGLNADGEISWRGQAVFCSRRGTASARRCGDAGDRRCRRARLSKERRGHLPGDRIGAHRGTNAHRFGRAILRRGPSTLRDGDPEASPAVFSDAQASSRRRRCRRAHASGSPMFTRRVVLDRLVLAELVPPLAHSDRCTTGSCRARSRSRSSEPTCSASGDWTHL